MSDRIITEYLSKVLVPAGTADLVRIGFHDGISGAAFYDTAFIQSCIQCMRRRTLAASVLDEKMNALETLAIHLLMSSAYLGDKESLNSFIENEKRRGQV